MNKPYDSIQYVYTNQNHINSILNILYKFNKPNDFNVGKLTVNHVCYLLQTNYDCYDYINLCSKEDLNQEWKNEKEDEGIHLPVEI